MQQLQELKLQLQSERPATHFHQFLSRLSVSLVFRDQKKKDAAELQRLQEEEVERVKAEALTKEAAKKQKYREFEEMKAQLEQERREEQEKEAQLERDVEGISHTHVVRYVQLLPQSMHLRKKRS